MTKRWTCALGDRSATAFLKFLHVPLHIVTDCFFRELISTVRCARGGRPRGSPRASPADMGCTGSKPPRNLVVRNAPCGGAGGGATLTTASVVVGDGGVGAITEKTAAGAFSGGYFYEAGASDAYELPIEVDANNGYFSALLTLSCAPRAAEPLPGKIM